MLSFLEIKNYDLDLNSNIKVLKKDDYINYCHSELLIDKAKSDVDELINEANRIYQIEKERGYKNGNTQAKNDIAKLMQETIVNCNNHYQSLKNDFIEIIMESVNTIINGFDDKELTLKTINTALKRVTEQKKIKIYVGSRQLDSVTLQVSELLNLYPSIDYISVHLNNEIKNGGCFIETDIGVIDATIKTQLTALRNALAKCYSESTD